MRDTQVVAVSPHRRSENHASPLDSTKDEHNVNEDRLSTRQHDIHKQGTFLEFLNPETEARFVEHRYGRVGLSFPIIVCYVSSFMIFSTSQMNTSADTLRDPPSKWLFSDRTYYTPGNEHQLYFYLTTMVITFVVPTMILLVHFFIRKRAPFPAKYLEMLYVFVAGIFECHHAIYDHRYGEYCKVNKYSLLLRDPYVPKKCDDFVEPYYPITIMYAFILPSRLRPLFLFVLIWLPTPFFSRTAAFDYGYVFRLSDYIFFFGTLIYVIGFVVYEHTLRKQFIQHEIVQSEIEETKRAQDAVRRLLDAMLPASVLKRLISNEEISDSGVVSTVFSDVAGFTSWCSAQKAESVVWMLNVMYTHFDNGLVQFDIEKVKTVGDAYWAICGLPDPNPNHILHICAFAEYMHRCVEQMGEDDKRHDLKIRVGVHTGNVCGGLVGSHQSNYDMFGTTNEVAELMEQRAPVGGILMSEPSYLELKKRWPKHEGELLVELQDKAVDTVQGTMSTYVLKTFDWSLLTIPPSCATNDTTTTTTSNNQHGIVSNSAAALADDGEPASVNEMLPNPEGDPPEATQPLATQRQKMSAASLKLHHTFDDEEVEAEFQQFMRTVFPNKLKAVNSMLGGMIFLIYVVMLAEGHSHPWYTHLLLIVDLILTIGLIFVVDRLRFHPVVGLGVFYVECNLLLFGLLSANRSVVSIDLFYLPFNFAVFFPTLGYVGGGVPYLYICAANIVFLCVPSMVTAILVKTVFNTFIHFPAIVSALWIIALRRSEMGQRQQFIDKKIADLALQQTRTQHKKVSELLSRMVPSFIVDELTIWVCGPRGTMIADNFPLVGILFARVPNFHNQFSDKTIDPLTVMGLIGNYASVCDSVLDDFPQCTKLKIIGDVLLFASGLVGAQSGRDFNPLESRKNDEACSVDTASLCSGDRSSAYSDSSLGDDPHLVHHLVSVASLACALATQVEDHFDGAKISAGMHCGPATGGVIGNDRLIYDVFGDTVNTASRVMSTSGEGVWASVKFSTKLSSIGNHGFLLGGRIERQMKGKGTVHVVSVAALPK